MRIIDRYDDHIFLEKIKDKTEKFRVSFLHTFKPFCDCQEFVYYEIFSYICRDNNSRNIIKIKSKIEF